MEVVQIFDYKGQFFRVLQETRRTQTAIMTIALFFLTVYAPPEY